jgi:A/G-specific adenine glycosylase
MDEFRYFIYEYYMRHGRILPWRFESDPYKVFVSEIMLQQTPVERVQGKYEKFLSRFPDVATLSHASLESILAEWRGLGYNRRGLYLKQAAMQMEAGFSGVVPSSIEDLTTLPGVGYGTACAVMAFAYNDPVVFLETNIRTVFIHFFFKDSESVRDSYLLPLVEDALDRNDPRNWYYALMDYGSMLKREGVKEHRKSTAYRRQSPFEGSDRQIRGGILKALGETGVLSRQDLLCRLSVSEERIMRNLASLTKEGFLCEQNGVYSISAGDKAMGQLVKENK